ncbi:hypothetical protein SH1V18_21680 [Vallitalea longa]|uniref:Uncharacterized protein n=1 Tax=Vallitalea longa TaxID=2936439 RepID=A0A9W6DFQ8_9FIRM|nr:tripartite tricarboxylate transporter substrate-binding protein [Vallitalea longa]GKX29688.1 hypothetical protein SH1V18_21680 [Vallitalea longa]
MKILKKSFAFILVLAMGVLMVGCGKKEVSTKDWPTDSLTIICPWAVGGLADQVNRAMSEYGKEAFGQPLLADNILGSGGAVALTQYIEEKPNGNKLIFGGEGSFAIAPLTSEVAYKFDDFIPVINIYSSTFVLSANPNINVNSIETLEEYFKQGNTIKVGTNGTASSEALQCAALLNEMGITYTIIPYEGANEALTAAISGEVDFAVTHASLAKEFVKSGDINPVVAFDEKKLVDEVYNLDCVADYGYDTWMTNICAVFMRAGTEQAIVDKTYDALKSILENENFLDSADNMGVTIDIMSGEEVQKYIESCVGKAKKYAELVE